MRKSIFAGVAVSAVATTLWLESRFVALRKDHYVVIDYASDADLLLRRIDAALTIRMNEYSNFEKEYRRVYEPLAKANMADLISIGGFYAWVSLVANGSDRYPNYEVAMRIETNRQRIMHELREPLVEAHTGTRKTSATNEVVFNEMVSAILKTTLPLTRAYVTEVSKMAEGAPRKGQMWVSKSDFVVDVADYFPYVHAQEVSFDLRTLVKSNAGSRVMQPSITVDGVVHPQQETIPRVFKQLQSYFAASSNKGMLDWIEGYLEPQAPLWMVEEFNLQRTLQSKYV